jgi:hypothetical protein
VRDKKVQLEIAKLVEFNDVFGVQQRFQKIADIIGNPIKKDTVTTNHSIDSATVHLQFAFTYKTWKGRPLVTVVDNVSYPGTGMSQGGGVSSHKEAGRPEMLSDSLLVTLHHYDDPNYESYGINLANNHWVHANIYYEYKHLKNAYKLEESGVDNLVFYPNPTQYSLPTDPEQFKTNLNEAYVKLHDSYLLQTG